MLDDLHGLYPATASSGPLLLRERHGAAACENLPNWAGKYLTNFSFSARSLTSYEFHLLPCKLH